MDRPPIGSVYSELLPSVMIFSERTSDYDVAFLSMYRRKHSQTFFDNVLFDSTAEAYTSPSFYCHPFITGLLLLSVDVTGSPTDIYFRLQFSDDNASWFSYVIGPWGDLRYASGPGDKTECLDFPVLAPWCRFYALSSGCSSSATFSVFARACFSG